jgi:hypothetical protein
MSKTDHKHRISPLSKYTVKRCVVCKKDTFYSDRISKVFKNDFDCLCKNCNSERQASYVMKRMKIDNDQLYGYADFGVSNKLLVTVSYFVGNNYKTCSYIISGNGSYYIGHDDVWSVVTGSFSTNYFDMSRLTNYEYTRLVDYIPELVMERKLKHSKLCQSIVDVTRMSCPGISTIFVNES